MARRAEDHLMSRDAYLPHPDADDLCEYDRGPLRSRDPGRPDWGPSPWRWRRVPFVLVAAVVIGLAVRTGIAENDRDAARRDAEGQRAEARGWCRIAELNADELEKRVGWSWHSVQHFSTTDGKPC